MGGAVGVATLPLCGITINTTTATHCDKYNTWVSTSITRRVRALTPASKREFRRKRAEGDSPIPVGLVTPWISTFLDPTPIHHEGGDLACTVQVGLVSPWSTFFLTPLPYHMKKETWPIQLQDEMKGRPPLPPRKIPVLLGKLFLRWIFTKADLVFFVYRLFWYAFQSRSPMNSSVDFFESLIDEDGRFAELNCQEPSHREHQNTRSRPLVQGNEPKFT
ncbi:hypothetical protein RR48_11921 [Papilio machaon]|uniref:Uncharacterized protein n=1 Tax=Papilio machaon TaxID=76193 RepID=A0A194RJR9_PAPMA|nr:hypothetical protein RR48_11921 [Papilio machaon]